METKGEEARRFFVLRRGRVKVTQVTPAGHQIVVRYGALERCLAACRCTAGRNTPLPHDLVVIAEDLHTEGGPKT